MRVTGGELAGRRLRVPRGASVRPTADRVRESVFGRLGPLEGRSVLDLYAGSGALGIEALSRGAAHVVFVDRAGACVTQVRRNLEALGVAERAEVRRGDAAAVVARLAAAGARYDLVLADPPYASEEAARVLDAVARAGLLAPGGMLVLETSRRHAPGPRPGLCVDDARRYGDTLVVRYVVEPADRGAAGGAGGPGPWAGEAGTEAGAEGRTGAWAGGRTGAEAGGRTGGEGGRVTTETAPRAGLALFPASFDPVTYGHLDLVHRARRVFPELVVAVAHNVSKSGTFTVEERLEMLEAALADVPGVRVTAFEGLLVDYAREIGARTIVRGLRANADFEYEFEMALMNRHLNPEVETLFLMTSQQFFYVSSSRLKELVRFGADIGEWVPPLVAKYLREKVGSA